MAAPRVVVADLLEPRLALLIARVCVNQNGTVCQNTSKPMKLVLMAGGLGTPRHFIATPDLRFAGVDPEIFEVKLRAHESKRT